MAKNIVRCVIGTLQLEKFVVLVVIWYYVPEKDTTKFGEETPILFLFI
jgi:hypothetical protein